MDRRDFIGGAMAGLALPKDFDWEGFLAKSANEDTEPENPPVRLKPVSDADVRQLLRDVDELKRWRGIHAGIDWASAGIDYPHPNLRVLYAIFGGGNQRLDPTGYQIAIPDASVEYPAFYILPAFSEDPSSVYARFLIKANPGAGASAHSSTIELAESSTQYSRLIFNGPANTTIPWDLLYRNGGSTYELFFRESLAGVSRPRFVFSGAGIVWGTLSSDPSGLEEGMTWYNTTTDKFRGSINTTAFNFAMDGGPEVLPFAAKSANYTTTANDGVITVDASGAARTITLVTAVGNAGLQYTIKKIDSSVNLVTIDGNGSQTIDGVVTTALSRQYEAITIISDGANWLVMSRY